MLQGPDYTNSLVGVLWRFRKENVALVGDIEGVFDQVKVCPEDQDSVRFLQWSGSTDEVPGEVASSHGALPTPPPPPRRF